VEAHPPPHTPERPPTTDPPPENTSQGPGPTGSRKPPKGVRIPTLEGEGEVYGEAGDPAGGSGVMGFVIIGWT
jgi:hypothetical protein